MTALTPILRNNPFRPLAGTERSMWDHLFGDLSAPALFEREENWIPTIDMADNEKEYVIKAELPGMNKDDIDISLGNGLLTLTGEKKQESKEDKDTYYYRESRYGSFSRSLRLPEDAAPDEVDATYKDGVLRVVVPKKEAAKPKKITVN
ncbi:MAG: Hsp20/alpha crystallin family protein [Desulfosudaceae bacterium]